MATQLYRLLLATDLLGVSYQYLNDSLESLRKGFEGGTEPASPVPYQVWYDTATGLKKERNAANDAWIVVGKLGVTEDGHLPTTGGVLSGPLDMGGQVISNLGAGTGLAAARVQELDLKAPIAAPFFTGDARVNQDPNGNDSLIRRSWAEGRYLKLAGGALTGPVTVVGNAAADLQPVPYQQLRDFVLFNLTTGHRHDGADARKVRPQDLDPAVTQGAWSAEDPPVEIHSGTPPSSWTAIDLTSHIPSNARTAFIRLFAASTVQGGTVFRFRAFGSSQDTSTQDWACQEIGQHTHMIVIELSADRKFEWRVAAGGSGSGTKLHLLGSLQLNW